MYLRQSYPASKPNNSFKPNLLHYSKSVAEKACHAFASTSQVGLTQALAIQIETSMTCYFQGCIAKGTTKEHIPPRSFFPEGEKEQLLTVRSCEKHNNAKSIDDLYVLAQICMNASPNNRAREVWESKIVPQLEFNCRTPNG